MASPALYTWRDVDRALAQHPDPPWLSATVDMKDVIVVCSPGKETEVRDTLRDELGSRLSNGFIRLESLPGQPRVLELYIDPTGDISVPRARRVVRPLWPDAHLPEETPLDESETVRVAAFFSYKGGVGRTTCLLATAGALLQRPKPARILVVDADLEAPGLTWNIPNSPDRISLIDALALIHDEDDWKGGAIPLIAERLSMNQERIELPSGRASFYFLPAFRDFDQIFSLPITFEQLVRARGRAHIVGDALIALGEALKVDVVLVDLRAGITEFSSPLLLDKRIQSILVTSCSRQSVDGVAATLEKMRQRIDAPTSPEVVISLVPPGDSESLVAATTEKILSALPLASEDGAILPDRGIHQVTFAQELIHFDSVEDLLARRIPGTDLGKRVAGQLASLLAPAEEPEPTNVPASTPADMESVIELARKLEYAETSGVRDLLPTAALTALVEHFSSTLPAAVVLGSKGAGKTFAWIQMVAAGDWSAFRELVLQAPAKAVGGLVFPLLGPLNLDSGSSALVKNAEEAAWSTLQSSSQVLPMEELRNRLERLGSELRGDSDSAFWTEVIASRLGLPPEAAESVESLAAALEQKSQAILLAADGFEDAFQLSPERPLSETQRRILRALFQRTVPQVRDLASPYLGIVAFVRRDLAEESIPQNFGQFEALYSKFSLVWSPTEALRLAAWLLDRAGRPVLDPKEIPTASYEELTAALQSFWGARMGSEKSKEAYTDRWVIAALSDLQGRLQPRDIVRLIRFAAEKDRRAARLAPQSLKGALAACSAEKIREIEQEIRALKPIFDKFRRADDEKKAIPFLPEDFDLSDDEVAFLKRQGIVTSLGEGTELYMPEIIRQGLRFRLKEGRRAKVLALYRAALKSLG